VKNAYKITAESNCKLRKHRCNETTEVDLKGIEYEDGIWDYLAQERH
jgi:hypothetical protein